MYAQAIYVGSCASVLILNPLLCLQVFYKKLLSASDGVAAVHLLLGFIGVWNLVLLTPVLVCHS